MNASDSRRPEESSQGPNRIESPPLVRRAGASSLEPSRRAGLRNAKLLAEHESPHQNWVLSEADAGAYVEDHVVPNSESFFVLAGEIELFGPGWRDRIGAGDFVYFRPGQSHGMRVITGPARYLVVFAPRKE